MAGPWRLTGCTWCHGLGLPCCSYGVCCAMLRRGGRVVMRANRQQLTKHGGEQKAQGTEGKIRGTLITCHRDFGNQPWKRSKQKLSAS
eukprot:831491-Pelagomonas_calceolata.AAC.3